jgi:uncharacterized integral membrane protein
MKAWWKSKTIWFNVLTVLAALLESSELVNLVPAEWHPAMLGTAALLNIVLRTVTTTGVR